MKENMMPGKRRSSILKAPRSPRIALQEVTENKGNKEKRSSRRVSFAETFQIKELVFSHHGMTEVNLTKEVKDKAEHDVTVSSPVKFLNERKSKPSVQYENEDKENLHLDTQCNSINSEIQHDKTDNGDVTKYTCSINETRCVGNGLLDERAESIQAYNNQCNEDATSHYYSFEIEETDCVGAGIISEDSTVDKENRYCIDDKDETHLSPHEKKDLGNVRMYINENLELPVEHSFVGIGNVTRYSDEIDETCMDVDVIYEGDKNSGSLSNKLNTVNSTVEGSVQNLNTNHDLSSHPVRDGNITMHTCNMDETMCVGNGNITTCTCNMDETMCIGNENITMHSCNMIETMCVGNGNITMHSCNMDETACEGFTHREIEDSMQTQFPDIVEGTSARLNTSFTDSVSEAKEVICYNTNVYNVNQTFCFNDDLSETVCFPATTLHDNDISISEHSTETICQDNDDCHISTAFSQSFVNEKTLDYQHDLCHEDNDVDNSVCGSQKDCDKHILHSDNLVKLLEQPELSSEKSFEFDAVSTALDGNLSNSSNLNADNVGMNTLEEALKQNLPRKDFAGSLDDKVCSNLFVDKSRTSEEISEKCPEQSSYKNPDNHDADVEIIKCEFTSTSDIIHEVVLNEDSKVGLPEKNVAQPPDPQDSTDYHFNTLDISKLQYEQLGLNTYERIAIQNLDSSFKFGTDSIMCNVSRDVMQEQTKMQKPEEPSYESLYANQRKDLPLKVDKNILEKKMKTNVLGIDPIPSCDAVFPKNPTLDARSFRVITEEQEKNSSEKHGVQKSDALVDNDGTSNMDEISKTMEKQEKNASEKHGIQKSDAHVDNDSTSNMDEINKTMEKQKKNPFKKHKSCAPVENDGTSNMNEINKTTEEQDKNASERHGIQKCDAIVDNDGTSNIDKINKTMEKQKKNPFQKQKLCAPVENDGTSNMNEIKTAEEPKKNQSKKHGIWKFDALDNDRTLNMDEINKAMEKQEENSSEKNAIQKSYALVDSESTNEVNKIMEKRKLDSQDGNDSTVSNCDTKKINLKEDPKLNSLQTDKSQNVSTCIRNTYADKEKALGKKVESKSSEKDSIDKLDVCSSSKTHDCRKRCFEEQLKLPSSNTNKVQKLDACLANECTLNTCEIRKRIIEELGIGKLLQKQGIFSEIVNNTDKYEETPKRKEPAISKLLNKLTELSKKKAYKWRITKDSNKINVSFLRGWYELEMTLQEHEGKESNFSIVSMSLQSSFMDHYEGCVEELSKCAQINLDRIRIRYSSFENASEFLEELSRFLCKLHSLIIDLRHVGVTHTINLKDMLLTVNFISHHLYQEISLTFTLDFDAYPDSVVHFKYHHVAGEPYSEEKLRDEVKRVLPGRNYFWRISTAVDRLLGN